MKIFYPFLRLMRTQLAWLSLAMLLSLITALAGVGLLALAGWFISAAAFAGLSASTVLYFNFFFPSAGVRFFSMVRILGRYGERVFSHDVTFKLLANLRVWFFRHIEPLAPGQLMQQRSGDLLNRIVSDIDSLDNLYLRVLTPFIVAFLMIGLMWYFLSFFNQSIATITLLLLLATAIFAPLLMSKLGNRPGKAIVTCIASLRSKVVDCIQGVTELTMFAAQDRSLATIMTEHDALIKQQQHMSHIKGLTMALMTALGGFSAWLALYLGVKWVQLGQLNGANLALIALAILAIFEVILPLPIAAQYLGQTRQAAQRILQLVNTKPSVVFQHQSQQIPHIFSLEFRNVSFRYAANSNYVLQDFNLQVLAGQHLLIKGPSGKGKTTIANLLARFWDSCAGEIFIGATNIRDLSEKDLRKLINFIPQRPHIFNATLRDNLLIANPTATDAQLMDALQVMQLADFVASLPEGLSSWAGEFGARLSGGQVRRLALTRAVLKNAPIWILDEPTEGLDKQTAQELLTAIEPILQNRTAIFISHRSLDPLKLQVFTL